MVVCLTRPKRFKVFLIVFFYLISSKSLALCPNIRRARNSKVVVFLTLISWTRSLHEYDVIAADIVSASVPSKRPHLNRMI